MKFGLQISNDELTAAKDSPFRIPHSAFRI
jgi:hypothetical protein